EGQRCSSPGFWNFLTCSAHLEPQPTVTLALISRFFFQQVRVTAARLAKQGWRDGAPASVSSRAGCTPSTSVPLALEACSSSL
uniref:Uncharacterized protein n=1 Tax=Chlorocebus sabaeus TaxID=60711 RepID=A0A0D9QZ18_CHLSB